MHQAIMEGRFLPTDRLPDGPVHMAAAPKCRHWCVCLVLGAAIGTGRMSADGLTYPVMRRETRAKPSGSFAY